MRRRLVSLVPFAIGLALFAVAAALLRRELAGHSLADVGAALRAIPARRIAAALAITATSYALLMACDAIGLAYLRRRLSLRRVALASFAGYGVSHSLGFAWLTGGGVRYRLYRSWGLRRREIAQLVLVLGLTFWSALLARAGVLLALRPPSLPGKLALDGGVLRAAGWGALALVAAYFACACWRPTPVRVKGLALRLPRPSLVIAQVVVGNLDWLLCTLVLHTLLPAEAGVDLLRLLELVLVAQVATVLSQVPGGLGVLESVVVLGLSDSIAAPTALGVLLAYRAIYYLLPLALGLALVGAHELARRRARARGAARAGVP